MVCMHVTIKTASIADPVVLYTGPIHKPGSRQKQPNILLAHEG